jgi:predicted metal-binding protein/2-polyprenyl-3-methyl-5-hydroxy-6-metoxy-1,4-benzoquinol methylase
MTFGFKNNDPAQTGFQFLEDLSTAYWYSQVLFTALDLKLFGLIDKGIDTVDGLAKAAACKHAELARLLRAMQSIGLIGSYEDRVYNTQTASSFLIPGTDAYLGDFFLYRRYMRPNWQNLTTQVAAMEREENPEISYEEKNFKYVAAMDALVRQKAMEIAELVSRENVTGTILDIGGGAGSLVRLLQANGRFPQALLFDLPEVIDAAHRLYPEADSWRTIRTVGGDFREHRFEEQFDLICLSNFLHAYGAQEARSLFFKSVSLLKEDGLVLIHDYFPDRRGTVPQKGALYDLAMMLNTFNGVCHDAQTICAWCREAGFNTIGVKDLSTDTGIIMARRNTEIALRQDPLAGTAADLGLDLFVLLAPTDVVTAAWAREKCKSGCEQFGKSLQCPPQGMDHEKTRQLLESYKKIYLVRGTPPGKVFHEALLSLEKKAFLMGKHKAFAMGAGPCTICPQCPNEGKCLFPHLARPSMEGSGIDVYATAANAGIDLKPVKKKGQYVTYIGLLLVE